MLKIQGKSLIKQLISNFFTYLFLLTMVLLNDYLFVKGSTFYIFNPFELFLNGILPSLAFLLFFIINFYLNKGNKNNLIIFLISFILALFWTFTSFIIFIKFHFSIGGFL